MAKGNHWKHYFNKRDLKSYHACIWVGIATALVSLLFRFVINLTSQWRMDFFSASCSPLIKFILFVPVVWLIMLIIFTLINRYPLIAGNGTEQAKAMINGHAPRTHLLMNLFRKFLGASLSLGTGMALGREGPSIQFGGTIGALFTRWFKIRPGREMYLISAGTAAGIAAALNSPLGGSVFIIESLLKTNNYRIAIYSLIGGLTGGLIAAALMPNTDYLAIPLVRPEISDLKILRVFIVMAVFMSAVGIGFTYLVRFFSHRFHRGRYGVKIRLGALTIWILVMGMIFPSFPGSGEQFMIEQAMFGTTQLWQIGIITLISIVFTAFCEGTLFPGGAFLPLLTVGGLCGRFFGALMVLGGIAAPEQLPYFMFIGMSSAYVIIMRTPFSSFLIVAEMTGRWSILLPSLAVGIMGFVITTGLRTESLSSSLYNRLLERLHQDPDIPLRFCTEVMISSYFDGKTPQTIRLPEGCTITEIIRDRESIGFTGEIALQSGDQLEFRVVSTEVEKVYQALICLSTDPR